MLGHLRLAEHVILSLHIVQPTTDAEECLASGQEVLRLRYVDEPDRMQQFDTIRLLPEFPDGWLVVLNIFENKKTYSASS